MQILIMFPDTPVLQIIRFTHQGIRARLDYSVDVMLVPDIRTWYWSSHKKKNW